MAVQGRRGRQRWCGVDRKIQLLRLPHVMRKTLNELVSLIELRRGNSGRLISASVSKSLRGSANISPCLSAAFGFERKRV
jgi:hypothetical protein